jgi:CheY-like chemotaxis protein
MLSGIMGGAFLLQDHVTSENGKKYLKIINDSAQRTSDLTDKLLTFGRKGNTSFSVENIIDAIKNSIEILKYTLDRKVDIEFLYEPDMILVNGNIAQLQNIFINLGINACHAMPNGGKLTFRAKVKPAGAFSMEVGSSHYVKIEVEDTGVGISQKNQQKVFEPFFTTREVNEGSGLGLATVYGSVKDHKGVIRLNSEEGKGTVFYIYLPVVNGNGNDMSVEAQQQAWLEKESGCILLVDDEKMVQDTNRIMLEKIGYTVLTADNGQEGVEVYKKNRHKIDLIILDMIMPKMNGLECFTEIKKISPDVKIIMASGFSSDSDVKKLKESGLISYIRKPFRISELVSVIKTARQGEAN